jgi:hypothetical protein
VPRCVLDSALVHDRLTKDERPTLSTSDTRWPVASPRSEELGGSRQMTEAMRGPTLPKKERPLARPAAAAPKRGHAVGFPLALAPFPPSNDVG